MLTSTVRTTGECHHEHRMHCTTSGDWYAPATCSRHKLTWHEVALAQPETTKRLPHRCLGLSNTRRCRSMMETLEQVATERALAGCVEARPRRYTGVSFALFGNSQSAPFKTRFDLICFLCLTIEAVHCVWSVLKSESVASHVVDEIMAATMGITAVGSTPAHTGRIGDPSRHVRRGSSPSLGGPASSLAATSTVYWINSYP